MKRGFGAGPFLALTVVAVASMTIAKGAPPSPAERRGVPDGRRAVPPTLPGERRSERLPDSIRTAKDPGARESWKPEGKDDPFLYAYGDTATYRDTAEGGIANLVGNARLLYRTTAFASSTVVYNRRTQIGTAPGKLQVDDEQNTIVGDQGEADYGKKVARIRGRVEVIARPKQDEKAPEGSARKDFRNPVRIQASEVVYNWKTKIADTSKDTVIRFTVRKRNWEVTADKIQYRGSEETAYLEGNVRAINDQGDEMRSKTAVVVLKDGEESIVLEPSQKGSKFRIEDEDDKSGPDKDKGKEPPPPTDPAKPGEPARDPARPAVPPPVPNRETDPGPAVPPATGPARAPGDSPPRR